MYIPIGIDCGNAEFLKNHNIRSFSFPFDWIVTYNGISEIIKNNFDRFIPKNLIKLNTDYQISFPHNEFPNDTEKILRRIERFKNILETYQEKITFIRKGHASHHHIEQNNTIKNDIIDAEDLDNILKEKYPHLRYNIIVIVVCGKCFQSDIIYTTTHSNIKIYNIATAEVDDPKYQALCVELFVKK